MKTSCVLTAALASALVFGSLAASASSPANSLTQGLPRAAGDVLLQRMQASVDQGILAGAVMLVADKTRVLHLEAVGYEDLHAQKPMQVDSMFWIASMSKPITAAALMMLVDEGRVKLDDAVEKFIPGFHDLKVIQPDGSLVDPSHPIKVREVLSHTSGLRFLNAKDHQKIDSVPLAVSIENDLLEPLLFDPGTKYLYSNEGTDVVGRIVEIVSGMSFEQFLQERLLTPLGMSNTTFRPSPTQVQRLAKSYKTLPEKGTLEEVQIPYLSYPLDSGARYPAPGGGLFSCATDVAKFCQMLANGGSYGGRTYLSSESVRLMTTKQTGEGVDEKYGFCLKVEEGAVFGHGGAFQTSMTVDHGVTRVFLVQHTGKWAKGDPAAEFSNAVRSLGLSKQIK